MLLSVVAVRERRGFTLASVSIFCFIPAFSFGSEGRGGFCGKQRKALLGGEKKNKSLGNGILRKSHLRSFHQLCWCPQVQHPHGFSTLQWLGCQSQCLFQSQLSGDVFHRFKNWKGSQDGLRGAGGEISPRGCLHFQECQEVFPGVSAAFGQSQPIKMCSERPFL